MPGLRKQTTARWWRTFRFRDSPDLIALAGNDENAGKKWLILTVPIGGRYLYSRKGCLDAGGLYLRCQNSRSNNFMTVCFAYTLIRSKLLITSARTPDANKGTGRHKHTLSAAGLEPSSPWAECWGVGGTPATEGTWFGRFVSDGGHTFAVLLPPRTKLHLWKHFMAKDPPFGRRYRPMRSGNAFPENFAPYVTTSADGRFRNVGNFSRIFVNAVRKRGFKVNTCRTFEAFWGIQRRVLCSTHLTKMVVQLHLPGK
jgi:hypothetical protein